MNVICLNPIRLAGLELGLNTGGSDSVYFRNLDNFSAEEIMHENLHKTIRPMLLYLFRWVWSIVCHLCYKLMMNVDQWRWDRCSGTNKQHVGVFVHSNCSCMMPCYPEKLVKLKFSDYFSLRWQCQVWASTVFMVNTLIYLGLEIFSICQQYLGQNNRAISNND